MSGFNAEAIKQDFPILDQIVNDEPLVYLNNATTTQKPKQVLEPRSHPGAGHKG